MGLALSSGRDILSAKYLVVSLSGVSVSDGLPGKGDSKPFLWASDISFCYLKSESKMVWWYSSFFTFHKVQTHYISKYLSDS
jgi:hypothetical protein